MTSILAFYKQKLRLNNFPVLNIALNYWYEQKSGSVSQNLDYNFLLCPLKTPWLISLILVEKLELFTKLILYCKTKILIFTEFLYRFDIISNDIVQMLNLESEYEF